MEWKRFTVEHTNMPMMNEKVDCRYYLIIRAETRSCLERPTMCSVDTQQTVNFVLFIYRLF